MSGQSLTAEQRLDTLDASRSVVMRQHALTAMDLHAAAAVAALREEREADLRMYAAACELNVQRAKERNDAIRERDAALAQLAEVVRYHECARSILVVAERDLRGRIDDMERERDVALADAAKLREEWVEPRLRAQAANTGLREAARGRIPLDGAEAQALEGSLAMTERERDEALAWRGEATTELMLGAKLITELRTERDAALAQLAERTRERDEALAKIAAVTERAVNLLGHSLCGPHQAEAASEPFDVFAAKHATAGCERCATKAEAEVARLTEALTPSGATKAAYMGEVFEHCPPAGLGRRAVSWVAIKDVVALIRQRAAIAPEPAKAGEVEKPTPQFPDLGCRIKECGFERRGSGWQCVDGAACQMYVHPGDPHYAAITAYYAEVRPEPGPAREVQR